MLEDEIVNSAGVFEDEFNDQSWVLQAQVTFDCRLDLCVSAVSCVSVDTSEELVESV